MIFRNLLSWCEVCPFFHSSLFQTFLTLYYLREMKAGFSKTNLFLSLSFHLTLAPFMSLPLFCPPSLWLSLNLSLSPFVYFWICLTLSFFLSQFFIPSLLNISLSPSGGQFHQHFCSFSLLTVWLCIFLIFRILAQKLLVKCWWNWHLLSLSLSLYDSALLFIFFLFFLFLSSLSFSLFMLHYLSFSLFSFWGVCYTVYVIVVVLLIHCRWLV